jgi:hypothetical protein
VSARVRLASFLGALGLGVSAFGGLVLPKLGSSAPVEPGRDVPVLIVEEPKSDCERSESV